MIEIREPTPRDVRIFGGLCLAFFGALGGIVLWRPAGLVGGSIILGAAWLTSLLLNRENRVRQLLGVLLPGLFALAGGSVVGLGADRWTVAGTLWGVGAVAASTVWVAPALGRRLYLGWMVAAEPIGWTLSHLVLGAVYYLVLTPIGLAMRLFGRDPMQRRFDRSATSYWIERAVRADPKRHFRQF